jgi:hypothetical protein
MSDRQREIEDLVLELLTNTPSSFAALYGYVFRQAISPPSVDDLLTLLDDFENRGWTRCRQMAGDGSFRAPTDLDRARASAEYRRWLDGAGVSELTADKLSLDEIGFWVEVPPGGRSEWSRRAGQESDHRWLLDQDDRTHTIIVHAEDLRSAECVLKAWLERHPAIRVLSDSRSVERVAEYRSRDGSMVKPGIRLRVAYEVGL